MVEAPGILHHLLLLVVFVYDFQVFSFYHVLSSVIPTPWAHMVCWMSCPVT